MNLQTFTSFEGRIGRATWWLASIVIWLVQGAAYGTASNMGMTFYPYPGAATGVDVVTVTSTATSLPVMLVLLASLWATLAVYAKRWHDRGKSGWWSLIGLIPVIGGLWILIELGFLKGDAGPNLYGPDPLRP